MLRIGIDLGGTKIEGVVLDAQGAVRESRRVATPANYPAVLDAVVELVEMLWKNAPGSPVGIGTPGVWDSVRGQMKNCNSTWLNGRPLREDLHGRLGGMVRMANDADCFALSEACAGAGADSAVVFGVILGTGVGGGFVVDGKLLVGRNGVAGEWGHTPLPYLRTDPIADPTLDEIEAALADRRCYCGRDNCIETFLSGPGLARTHRERVGGDATAVQIASGGVAGGLTTMQIYQRMLARSLAQIINVIDPDVIVLGGGISNVEALYGELPKSCARYVFSDRLETPICRPRYGDASGVRGAAWLWPADYTS